MRVRRRLEKYIQLLQTKLQALENERAKAKEDREKRLHTLYHQPSSSHGPVPEMRRALHLMAIEEKMDNWYRRMPPAKTLVYSEEAQQRLVRYPGVSRHKKDH